MRKFIFRSLLIAILGVSVYFAYGAWLRPSALLAYGPNLPAQLMRVHARGLCAQGQGLLLHGPVYRLWEFGEMSTDETIIQISQLDRQQRLHYSRTYYVEDEEFELTEQNWYHYKEGQAELRDESNKLIRRIRLLDSRTAAMLVPSSGEEMTIVYTKLWERLARFTEEGKLSGSAWYNPSGSRRKMIANRMHVDYVFFLEEGDHGFPAATYFASYVQDRAAFWQRWFEDKPAAEQPVLANRFEYLIDAHGNWTECRSKPYKADGSLQPGKQTVVRRIIQYY